ncbi:MAG: hypothetical protein Q8L34_03400 [Candidatus Woesearchaeota archaeon]|nr:hypothetical protein [Candidatus Woesearchaeota archaeon]
MGINLFLKRVQASFICQFDELWTFKVDLGINVLNTFLEVIMWYFLAKIVDPATLGYENVGYLPFVLIGSLAIFFVDSVYNNFTGRFNEDRKNGLFKLAYLSNMGVVEYFSINFLVSVLFDLFTIFLPMFGMYFLLITLAGDTTAIFFSMANVITILIALGIFIIGNLGFQLMTVGSVLFLKEGDPISFFMQQFNRLFSGQLFPVTFLPKFIAFLPKILPAAYIILIWRDTLFLNKTFADASTLGLILAGLVVNILVFFIGMYVFYYGIKRAKIEGRWF